MSVCFSALVHEPRSGTIASTSAKFSNADCSCALQPEVRTSSAHAACSFDAWRTRSLLPPNSRAMRRFTRIPMLRVQKLSHAPGSVRGDSQVPPTELEGTPFLGWHPAAEGGGGRRGCGGSFPIYRVTPGCGPAQPPDWGSPRVVP